MNTNEPNRLDRAAQVLALRRRGVGWDEIGARFGRSRRTCQRWAAAARAGHAEEPGEQPTASGRIEATYGESEATITLKGAPQSLDQLLDAAQVDRRKWRAAKHIINFWGNENKPQWQIKAWLERIPEWLKDGGPVRLAKHRPPVHTCAAPDAPIVVLPDTQFGFRWNYETRQLEPLHDPRACALAVELVRLAQPRAWVQLGDLTDFAEFSTKYSVDPELRQTTQPTIQACHDWLAALRDAAPDAQGHVIKGNHEQRLDKALTDLLPALLRLRPVGESERALSMASLLRLHDLGINYVEGYPGPGLWIDGVLFEHGTTVAQGGGATAARVLKGAQRSTIFGHIHRLEMAARTVWIEGSPEQIWSISPGTLSRIDGAVPGVSERPDWQQGVCLLWIDGGRVYPEIVPFVDGSCYFRGRKISA